MATIYTLKSKLGIVHFYGDLTVKGKRYRRYLGLSKKTAVLALQELEYQLRFGSEDDGGVPITYSKAILKFLVHLEMSGTGSSQIKYVSSGLEAFRKYCSTQGVAHMNDASKELCRNHMVEYSQSKLYNFYCPEKDGSWKLPSVKSQNSRISQNRRFYKWCMENDFCNQNPWLAVPRKRVRGANKPRYAFSKDEVKLILKSAGEFHDFFYFLAFTGQRSTDAFVLNSSAFKGDTLTLQLRKTGSWAHRIPIAKHVVELLAPRIERGGLIFPECRTDRRRRKARAIVQSHFEPQFVRDNQIALHTFRHFFSHQLLDRGVPKEALQSLLSHRSITTTERYANHLSYEKLAPWVE
jgi:site-specific recombinase XerD